MSRNNRVCPQGLPPVKKSQIPSQYSHNEQQTSAISINKLEEEKQRHHGNKKQGQNMKPTLYTCRICLQQHPALHANTQQQLINMLSLLEEQKKLCQPKYLITACSCHGTAGYVHQKCMIQWIDAQYKRSKEKQMKCEICLAEILYDKKFIPYFEFTCKNLDDISGCNVACLGSVTIMLGVFVVLSTQSSRLSFNQLTQLTICVLIGIMLVLMGISIAMIVKEAFYKVKKETVKVYSNDQIDIKGILKHNLTHYDRRSSTYRTNTNVRSIRSARSLRTGRQNQRQTYHDTSLQHTEPIQPSRRPISSRSQRTSTQSVQNNQHQPPLSQRSIRTVRMPQTSRSIQVRSRSQIQDQPQNY